MLLLLSTWNCVLKNPKALVKKIKHAGAIFLGSMSTEAFGDYVAGPSHVLPTGGAARFSSPLSVYDFLRMPSVISISFTTLSALSCTSFEREKGLSLPSSLILQSKRGTE